MPSTHRTYDKEFRQEAVNLLLSSGRPLKRIAAETRCYPQFPTNLAEQGFQQGARSAGRFGGAKRPQRSGPCRSGRGDPPPAARSRISSPPARDLISELVNGFFLGEGKKDLGRKTAWVKQTVPRPREYWVQAWLSDRPVDQSDFSLCDNGMPGSARIEVAQVVTLSSSL
jgi:hypothetical protein